MSDERLTRYLAWQAHSDIVETRRVLKALSEATLAGTGYHWTIVRENQACGLISLIDVRRLHRTWTLSSAEIAYWVGVPYQGQGFATEAAAAVVDMAFQLLGLNRLTISHTSQNQASASTPCRLQFRYIGREDQFFCKDGTWYDMNHYELLSAAWDGSVAAQYGVELYNEKG